MHVFCRAEVVSKRSVEDDARVEARVEANMQDLRIPLIPTASSFLKGLAITIMMGSKFPWLTRDWRQLDFSQSQCSFLVIAANEILSDEYFVECNPSSDSLIPIGSIHDVKAVEKSSVVSRCQYDWGDRDSCSSIIPPLCPLGANPDGGGLTATTKLALGTCFWMSLPRSFWLLNPRKATAREH